MKPYCRDFTVQLRIFQVYWGITHAYLNTFYFCSILPCSVTKEKITTQMRYFCKCVLDVHKYICSFYALSSYFEGLRGSAKQSCKRKNGPSNCIWSRDWHAALRLFSQLNHDWLYWPGFVRAVGSECVHHGLGKKAEKAIVKTSYLEKKVNFALNWGYISTAPPVSCSRFEI